MLKAMMLNGIVVINTYLVSAPGEEAVAAMGLAAPRNHGRLLLGNADPDRAILRRRETGALESGFSAGLIVNLGAAAIGLILVSAIGGRLIDDFAGARVAGVEPLLRGSAFMEGVRITGVDLARTAFQAHGAGANGSVAFHRKLSRAQL